jgi:predicted nicotinamide N-methyase
MTANSEWIETLLRSPVEDPDAWQVDTYRCREREILYARPREPDRLLDDPAVLDASRSTDYMPYWAYIWPGASILADFILTGDRSFSGPVLEIGCGLGLSGLAALAAGMHVTFSDYSPAALALAAHNAQLNGYTAFRTRVIDWKAPPRAEYELILGADVLYEARCVDDVLRVMAAMLAHGGSAWLSDPGRSVADAFPVTATARGYAVRQIRSGSGRIFVANNG